MAKTTIITVPTQFDGSQRKETRNCDVISGGKVMQIFYELTTIEISCGLDMKSNNASKKNVLNFDPGGSTLDVAIKEGMSEVKVIIADTKLGGEYLVNMMVNHNFQEFKGKNKIDIGGNTRAFRRLEVLEIESTSQITEKDKVVYQLHVNEYGKQIYKTVLKYESCHFRSVSNAAMSLNANCFAIEEEMLLFSFLNERNKELAKNLIAWAPFLPEIANNFGGIASTIFLPEATYWLYQIL